MKVVAADEAAALVKSGDVVAVCGVVWNLVPEVLLEALERRFLETGEPRDLTETHLHVYGMGPGTGLERFAHAGMTKRVVGGSFAPPYWFKDSEMNRMVADDEVEAFLLPAGIIAAGWGAAGAGRPGVLSEVGLNTFVDPRQDGGTVTERARRSGHTTCEVVRLQDRDWLYYRAPRIDVSFIRATSADGAGNLTFEDEPTQQAVLQQALATRASGGRVIAQVKRVVETGSLDPQRVRVPAHLVDAVVVAPEQRMAEYGVHEDSPAFVGGYRMPEPPVEAVPDSPEARIARRAAREISPGDVINLGAGLPVLLMTKVLRESGADKTCTVTVEHGSLGGANLGGFLCNAHWNPTAIVDAATTLDFYAGGALAVGFLGFAQIDGSGSVNVSKVGSAMAGIGGFMDIAQGARTVVFCGTLTYRDTPKLVEQLQLVSFSGPGAIERGQRVLYVTDRGVFRLTDAGLELIEIAAGLDVDRDIRPYVDCDFIVADSLEAVPA